VTHPIDSPKVREDVKLKTAILGTRSGKIVVEFDQANGRIVKYAVRVEFAREDVS
jgi:hypothetical protein